MVHGTVRRVDGTPAANVEVRFEQVVDGRVKRVETIRTKENGIYSLKLTDGTWTGTACDSSLGYRPTLWEITIDSGEVTQFHEVNRDEPEIIRAEVAVTSGRGIIQTGDRVVLTGAGFRCAGHVVVEVAGMKPVIQATFSQHDDDKISFGFPALHPSAGNQHVVVDRARFTYVLGPVHSNRVEYRARPTPDLQPAQSSLQRGSGRRRSNSPQHRNVAPMRPTWR